MKQLVELLCELVRKSFWGEVRVKFNSGKIVHVEKIESLDVGQFQPKE